MAKKSSESSPREKLTSVSADYIFSKPLSEKQKSMLRRLKDLPDSQINYEDIPALTEEQMRSVTRPARKLIAARLDPDVLEWLQSFGPGYSTRINTILRAVMENQKRLSKLLS